MADNEKGKIKIGPEIAPGTHAAIRRDADGTERTLSIRSAADGTPMSPNTEIALMSAEERDGWRDVQTVYRNGPAQVATPAYRDGYDRIFGKKPTVGEA